MPGSAGSWPVLRSRGCHLEKLSERKKDRWLCVRTELRAALHQEMGTARAEVFRTERGDGFQAISG